MHFDSRIEIISRARERVLRQEKVGAQSRWRR
jgi:hypothetical protein